MTDPDAWFDPSPPIASVEGDRGDEGDDWRDESPDFELCLRYSRALLDSLTGSDGLEPTTRAGSCDDCGVEVSARFELGQVALCRGCRRMRQRAGQRSERPLEHKPLPPPPLGPGQLGRTPHE